MLTWFWKGVASREQAWWAITALVSAAEPYTFHRVAGTSAGAIVASMLAAGYDAAAMNTVMTDLDFAQFEDERGIFGRHFEKMAEGLGLLMHEGLFLGQFLHDWIERTLAEKNVHTWGDLKDDDPGSSLPPAQRYKLVVIVSDVSRGRRRSRDQGWRRRTRLPLTCARPSSSPTGPGSLNTPASESSFGPRPGMVFKTSEASPWMGSSAIESCGVAKK